MSNTALVQMRLAAQHLANPDFTSPEAVVRWFGAMQAQDLQAGLHTLNLRLKKQRALQEIESLIEQRRLLRTWPMRGTIHFVPPEDARWMIALLARRVNRRIAGLYKKAGLTQHEFALARDVLTTVLAGRGPVRRAAVVEALTKAGLTKKGEPTAMFIVVYWAQEGLICLGPRDGKQQTLVLLDEWLPPEVQNQPNPHTALSLLARRYFTSHGPATIQDFAWWSGLTITEAKQSLGEVAPELIRLESEGKTYWHAPHFQAMPQKDAVYLLANYDEYTVAYKDRSAFVDSALSKAESQSGIGPSIIANGQLVGTWKRTLEKSHVAIGLHLFHPLTVAQRSNLDRALAAFGQSVELPVRTYKS